MKKTCKQCGKEFELSGGEIKFYKSKNLNLPNRCKECREANKKKNAEENVTATAAVSSTDDNTTSTSVSSQNAKSGGKTYGILGGIVAVIAAVLFMIFGGGDSSTASTDGSSTTTTVTTSATKTEGSSQSTTTSATTTESTVESTVQTDTVKYTFRNQTLLDQHYEKHGIEMGFDSAEAYMIAANKVIEASGVLHKLEAEDGDDVYFLPDTEEFVVVSTDGYIRTYYYADIEYFNRQ